MTQTDDPRPPRNAEETIILDLHAENERLRAALKSIASMPGTNGAVAMVWQMTGLAVAALEFSPPEPKG